jgi:hypothetical protein
MEHTTQKSAEETARTIMDLRQKLQRLAGIVATLTPSPAAAAENRRPSGGCMCGACLACLTAAMHAMTEKAEAEAKERRLATARVHTLQRQLDSAERIIMDLKEENLLLAKENQRARISVERMAGLFE